MDQPTYLHDDIYHYVLDKLETVHLSGLPEELRTRLMIVLGDIGNIWPASCFTGDETIAV